MLTFLTKPETAALIRVHPDTVQAMLDRGDLEGFQSGRITRISAASVERLIGGPLEEEVQADSTEPHRNAPEEDGGNGIAVIEPEEEVGVEVAFDELKSPEDRVEPEAFAAPHWGEEH